MLGIIVTGHGDFGTAMTKSVKMLSGDQDNYAYVDFKESDNLEDLNKKIKEAIDSLNKCEKILAFADLTGGSPFNVCLKLKMECYDKLEIVGGVNLPALLDACMTRTFEEDYEKIISGSIETGKEEMNRYVTSDDDDEEFEE